MIYFPSLFDYTWDVTIQEVKLCPTYPVWAFIEFCTTMFSFAESLALDDLKDLIARCFWHGVELQERIGPVDGIPYWECPSCIKQYTDYIQEPMPEEARSE